MIIVMFLGLALFVAAWAFRFSFSKLIYKPEEVEQCKVFVINNANIQHFFGTIKTIKLRFSGGGRSVSTKEGTSGSCSFRIKGSKQKGIVKVKWRKSDGKIIVTQLSMRECLASTRILWPESKARSAGCLLPSHVWDGIILLVMVPLFFFFYVNTKRNGRLVRIFFPFINWSERSRDVMELLFLVAAFGNTVYSILCFLNIATLF